MKLIGIAGQFASGKDTFADYLMYKLNKLPTSDLRSQTWYRASFAYNVKRIFCDTFGVDMDFIEKWKRKDEIPPGFNMNVRKCLTFIGDGFRDIKSDIWIESLLQRPSTNLIISDVRYINECNAIRNKQYSHEGHTVLLWRPGHENNFQNRSEQELMQFVEQLKDTQDGPINVDGIPFDFWIKNDGDLSDLYSKVDRLIVPFLTKT